MDSGRRGSRASFWLLCLALFIAIPMFGVPRAYPPPMRAGLAAAQLLLILGLGWAAGLSRIASPDDAGRKAMAAAALLVWPVATFSLMPGFGPPEFTDVANNLFRFYVLLVDVIAIGAGTFLLQDVLGEAGERMWSRLGFAAMLSATPIYLVWAVLMLASARAAAAGTPWRLGAWRGDVQSIVDILQFFGAFLTYLAGGLFAAALFAARLTGRTTAAVLAGVAVFAEVCMLVRGLDNPPLSLIGANVLSFVGWAAGIPAVPWLSLCVMGLILLRRPASQAAAAAA